MKHAVAPHVATGRGSRCRNRYPAQIRSAINLVGLGFGSLTGQRTTTTMVLIALEIIVTPLLARTQLTYFIDGQRLLVGVAMDQLRPAWLASPNALSCVSSLRRTQRRLGHVL